jgi:Na+/melibiose symporter-like transporter
VARPATVDETTTEDLWRPPRRLGRNRDFNIFWSGQTLSALGDAFGFLALPLLVLQATGSVAQMGLVTGAFGVGQLIAGILSGPLVDRVDRRRLMILCDLGRALLYCTIPLVWSTAGPQLWLIYVVTLVGALLGNTFAVANITAIANLVARDQLTAANSRLQASYSVMFLAGPMLAGLVSQQFGPATAIGIDALSFLASALTLLFVRLHRSSAEAPAPADAPRGRDALLAGVRFLWQQPVLRWLTILLSAGTFLATAGLDLFIYYLKHDLGNNDAVVGVVFGVASVGSLIGAVGAPAFRRRFGFAVGWLGSSLLIGIALAPIGLARSVPLVAALAAVFSLAQTVRGINSISLRQEITPDHLLGRVTAAFWTLMTVPGPLGAAVMAALAAGLGAPLVLGLMGGGTVLIALIGFFTPIWTTRHAPHDRAVAALPSAGDDML